MVSIDLNRKLPTAIKTETAEMRAARYHDVFELLPLRANSRRADDPSVWLQGFVSQIAGRPLQEVVGFFAEGLPKIIGADLSDNQFNSFLAGFQAAITSLGLTGSTTTARGGRS